MTSNLPSDDNKRPSEMRKKENKFVRKNFQKQRQNNTKKKKTKRSNNQPSGKPKNQQSTSRWPKSKMKKKQLTLRSTQKKERWNQWPKNQQQQSTYLEQSEKEAQKQKSTINSEWTSNKDSSNHRGPLWCVNPELSPGTTNQQLPILCKNNSTQLANNITVLGHTKQSPTPSEYHPNRPVTVKDNRGKDFSWS